jgi:hypothetical protein
MQTEVNALDRLATDEISEPVICAVSCSGLRTY